MKINIRPLLTFSFLILLLAACQTDDEISPNEEVRTPGQVRTVDSEDIPDIIDQIVSITGPREKNAHISNDGKTDILDNIDFDEIMEVIDTLSNANYTFNVDDRDKDPFTFVNLVVKDRLEGGIDTPYLLYYEVDSTARDDFALSGFSMNQFTGTVIKRYLNVDYSDSESTANLETRSSIDGNCNLTTQFDKGSTDTGDSSNGSDGFSGDYSGVTYYWECESDVVPVNGGNDCDFVGQLSGATITDPGCSSLSTTQYVLETRCRLRSFYNSTASDCPEPETEDIGIILDSYTEEHAEARLSIELHYAISQGISELVNQNFYPGDNLDWGEFFDLLETVLIDFGLIDVIPIIGEAHEFTQAIQYFDQGEFSNGVLAMTGVIIGFIPAGKMVKTLSRLNDIRKAVTAFFRLYRFKKYFKRIGVLVPKFEGAYKFTNGSTVFSSEHYRWNLKVFTGFNPPSNVHAHHIFPQKGAFSQYWERAGINIHDPKHMTWWEGSDHLNNVMPYENLWTDFFNQNPNPTANQILDKGKEFMKIFGVPTHL